MAKSIQLKTETFIDIYNYFCDIERGSEPDKALTERIICDLKKKAQAIFAHEEYTRAIREGRK